MSFSITPIRFCILEMFKRKQQGIPIATATIICDWMLHYACLNPELYSDASSYQWKTGYVAFLDEMCQTSIEEMLELEALAIALLTEPESFTYWIPEPVIKLTVLEGYI